MDLNKDLIYVGDLHSEFKTFTHLIKRYKITNSTLIQVGDFGLGFTTEEKDRLSMVELNILLKKINSNLLVIRGNHDNPKFFDRTFDLSNIRFLPDYTRIELNGLNHLFVGGATSVDRVGRLRGMSNGKRINHWPDEIFVLDEGKLKEFNDIDVLVTHSAPTYAYPFHTDSYDKNMMDRFSEDKNLRLDIIKERNDIDLMFQILRENGCKIQNHYYGHFHQSYRTEVDGCIHQLLNINEFK